MEPVRRAYGAVAEQYIELFASTDAVHADDLAFIDRHLLIESGPVLDAGCGPGHLTAHLRAQGVEATGIDLTPEFIAHARGADPDGRYEIGSMLQLPVADASVVGILAWYSLVHLPPDDLDRVLVELRRVLVPGGVLVAGFFDGDEVGPFDHKVVTAYRWPVDDLSARLARAGFTELERERRSGIEVAGHRPHAAIAALAR